MFKLSELECFDSMMFRMFKQEMETLITRHETYRFAYYIFLVFEQIKFKLDAGLRPLSKLNKYIVLDQPAIFEYFIYFNFVLYSFIRLSLAWVQCRP